MGCAQFKWRTLPKIFSLPSGLEDSVAFPFRARKEVRTFQYFPRFRYPFGGEPPQRCAHPKPFPSNVAAAPFTTVGDLPEKSPPPVTRRRRGSTRPPPCGGLVERGPTPPVKGAASTDFPKESRHFGLRPTCLAMGRSLGFGSKGRNCPGCPRLSSNNPGLRFLWAYTKRVRLNVWKTTACAVVSVSPLYSRAHYAKGTAGRGPFRPPASVG